jgi:hypothetical protein
MQRIKPNEIRQAQEWLRLQDELRSFEISADEEQRLEMREDGLRDEAAERDERERDG